ncbi:hypothetical protein CDL12_15260 [Handroanthus impetiginosus]|uniref:GIL1/IRKI C-terminal domain-containing protein n=1 Tax=Handroanthus impetiginosus TaxID=429701 RepID=A0A2G9H490_9LAMI|nr:hypothetical protein CDL12_15260 [Handroanthus impetiginosus]
MGKKQTKVRASWNVYGEWKRVTCLYRDAEVEYLDELGRYRRTKPPAMFLRKHLPIIFGMRSIHLDEAIKTLKSIGTFVRLLISKMESANWDLEAIASSIKPGISFWKPNHKCFAFESYHEDDKNQRLYFDRFLELKSVRPGDYLARKPKSLFASFCRRKYLKLVHPKMEASFFGNLNLRNSINSGELPETPFFSVFSEMAKRVWLLHCLALSFDPEISIFQVSKGNRFSEVYMESLSDEAFGAMETDPRVALTVVPGFRIGKTIIQCKVYLC